MNMKKTSLFFLLAFLSLAASAQLRQHSNTQGFQAYAGVHSLGWTSTYFQFLDENAGSGVGGGIQLGYGVTQLLEPYVGYDFTSLSTSDVDAESFHMNHLDVGLRFNLGGTILRLRPFLEGGFSRRSGTIKHIINGTQYNDIKFSGGTPHFGGGVRFFPSKGISVIASGLFTTSKKNNLTVDDQKSNDKPDVTTFRIGLGIGINISQLMGE